MNVKGKYLKDESGTIFSPVTSCDTVYSSTGKNISPQAAIATFGSDKWVSCSTAYQAMVIPFDTIKVKCGNSLSISNNRVVIGPGIKYVMVCGKVCIWNSPETNECAITLQQYRGSTPINEYSTNTSKIGTASLLSLVIPPAILDVQQNDTICIWLAAPVVGSYKLMGRTTDTYLTVEKIG